MSLLFQLVEIMLRNKTLEMSDTFFQWYVVERSEIRYLRNK